MDEFLQQVVDNMRKNEFEVVELHTAQEACDYLNERIAAGKTVGVGGSVSVRATGILEKLQEKGCTVYSHWGVPKEEVNPIRRKAIGAYVYLCSANAVTRQGKLVLIDGAGNRAAAVCFARSRSISSSAIRRWWTAASIPPLPASRKPPARPTPVGRGWILPAPVPACAARTVTTACAA